MQIEPMKRDRPLTEKEFNERKEKRKKYNKTAKENRERQNKIIEQFAWKD